MGLKIHLITRHPEESGFKCHAKLRENSVPIHYDADIHAKIVVVDDRVAIVSSMNFISDSSAGKTWEAGIVTTDVKTIESIQKAIALEMKLQTNSIQVISPKGSMYLIDI